MLRTPDLLLHPVRLRVIRCFLGGRDLTTADLRGELPDIPPATLYRHVAVLAEAGVLESVSERKVRGTFERTYRMVNDGLVVDAEQAAEMSEEEHADAFVAFVGGLLGDFGRYLAGGDVDLHRDRVGYRHVALNLTDDELDDLVSDLQSAVRARIDMPPAPGRRRRMLTTVLLPADAPHHSGTDQ